MDHFSVGRRAFTIASAAASLGLPWTARAQPNPTRLVVGFPPGGTLDFVARAIAQPLGQELGRPVIVDNKAGANGVIGGQFVARAAPDLATLWLTSVGAVAISPTLTPRMPFDPQRDLTPVSLVARNVAVLVVSPESPYDTAEAMVAAARKGANLTLASSGNGSVPHLAIELVKEVAKIKILHVPYKGGAPALNDVMGGMVDGYFSDIPGVIALIKGGRVKPVGTAAARRHPLLPQVKTFAEMGYPGVEVDNWHGLFAPRGSPPPEVERVGAALRHVLTSTAVASSLEASGAQGFPSTPGELAAQLRQDTAKWGRLIKANNITIE